MPDSGLLSLTELQCTQMNGAMAYSCSTMRLAVCEPLQVNPSHSPMRAIFIASVNLAL